VEATVQPKRIRPPIERNELMINDPLRPEYEGLASTLNRPEY